MKELTPLQIKKGMKKKSLKFVGSITEEQIRSLKKGYVYYKAKNEKDIVGGIFGIGNRNIYVYEVVKNE